jgi:hypothetical protein
LINRDQHEQVAGISRQADDLRTRLRARETEIDALNEMPGDVQFGVWLRRYGFVLVITVAASKRHQITREAKRVWTADDAIRYASGVMTRTQEQQRVHEESMEDKSECSAAPHTQRLLNADPDSAAGGPRNPNVQATTVRKL